MSSATTAELRVDPSELRCPLCASPPEGRLERRASELICQRCGAAHPVRLGIAILLAAEDRASSLARADELGGAVPPPIEVGELSDRPLAWRDRARLSRRALREAARASARALGLRPERKPQERVKRKYEREKYNYYRMNERLMPLLLGGELRVASGWRYKRELARALHDVARDLDARRLVEVGCGDGTNLWALDRFHPGHGFELFGFDYSFYRCAIASHHVAPAHQVWNGDAKRIALPSRCADLAVTVHCLEHMRYDNASALREIARLSRYVLLLEPFFEHQSTWGRWHNAAADYARDLSRNARDAGLEAIDFRPLGLGSPFNQTGLLLARSRDS